MEIKVKKGAFSDLAERILRETAEKSLEERAKQVIKLNKMLIDALNYSERQPYERQKYGTEFRKMI